MALGDKQRREVARAAAERKAARGPLRTLRVTLRRRIRQFGVGRGVGLAVLAVILSVQSLNPLPLQTLRIKVFDFYQVMKPREQAPQPVAIVDLDEESLAAVGQWPWPRTTVAQLATRLMDYGVIAVAFDMVFAEPDRMSPGRYGESIRGLDPDLRKRLAELPDNDQVFAEVLRNSPIVLGQVSYHREIAGQAASPAKVPIAEIGGDPRPALIRFPSVVRNIPLLEEAARGAAMFNLAPENDGVVRRVPVMMVVGNVIVPALSLELLRVATGQRMAYAIKRDAAGIKSIVLNPANGSRGFEIPTDQRGRLWVHYAPRDTSRIVSAKDVLTGEAPKEKLAGKFIFVGTSAAGLLDIRSTPINPTVPGVEIHAQIFESILTRSHLKRPHWAPGAEMLMMAGVGLLLIALIPVLGAFLTLVLGGLLAAVVAYVSWSLYVDHAILLDASFASVGGLAIYGTMLFVNYAREESRRRQVRGAFRHYLSPDLVDQLAEHPEQLVLGGETKEMSFLFCDVRGFTAISELYKDDPQGLTRLMNRFLTPLTKVILDKRGTIDKYMGDAIMAFWNAPLDDPVHARHACEAALDMLVELEELNNQRRVEAEASGSSFIPLRIGIGINSGPCVVGNIGSDQRFDYSVLGDSVNLASRLEGQSKTYGVDVVIGSETARQIGDDFATLELDLIRVKGKTEPETIHALLGRASLRQDPSYLALAEKNRDMLARYRDMNWDDAERLAAELQEMDGVGADLKGLFAYHRDRIKAFRAAPPDAGWDGIYTAIEK